ncbi:MAG: protein-L-isoaspartate O-methyltransferase [Pseudomonadota bacterium]
MAGFEANMDYQAARKHMVASQVRPNDVTDLALQKALEAVPREKFLPAHLRDIAYVEREHVYGATEGAQRVLLMARDFAKLLAVAKPRPGDHVLDVACGTGYSTAILANLCEMVIGLESDEKMRTIAQSLLSDLSIDNTAIVDGDVTAGDAAQGPYDLIVIAAAIAREPTNLLEQLKPGGRLVTIWRQGKADKGVMFRRSENSMSRVPYFDAGASHVLAPFAAEKEFQF